MGHMKMSICLETITALLVPGGTNIQEQFPDRRWHCPQGSHCSTNTAAGLVWEQHGIQDNAVGLVPASHAGLHPPAPTVWTPQQPSCQHSNTVSCRTQPHMLMVLSTRVGYTHSSLGTSVTEVFPFARKKIQPAWKLQPSDVIPGAAKGMNSLRATFLLSVWIWN